VDVELMTPTRNRNVIPRARRAERLIQKAPTCWSGRSTPAASAIAQVAEQRGIRSSSTSPRAADTEQGYKFVFRNFQDRRRHRAHGPDLIGELFQATSSVPRTAVYMHVNDTFARHDQSDRPPCSAAHAAAVQIV